MVGSPKCILSRYEQKKMSPKLTVFAALSRNMNSAIRRSCTNQLQFHLQGSQHHLLTSTDTCTHVHMYSHQCSCIHINNLLIFKKIIVNIEYTHYLFIGAWHTEVYEIIVYIPRVNQLVLSREDLFSVFIKSVDAALLLIFKLINY